jgi:hypothetical protein
MRWKHYENVRYNIIYARSRGHPSELDILGYKWLPVAPRNTATSGWTSELTTTLFWDEVTNIQLDGKTLNRVLLV